MDEARELVMLETQIALPSWDAPDGLPRLADEAIVAISRLEAAALQSRTLGEVRHQKRTIEVIQVICKESDEVRKRAQRAIANCDWRIGVELIADEENEAKGGEYYHQTRTRDGQSRAPTLEEKVGDRKFAWRAKKLGTVSRDTVMDFVTDLHLSRKEAVLSTLVDLIRTGETRERREASLNAEPFPDGMEYRIGDCRTVMEDIADDSVAAIITDPPYGRDALSLVEFAAEYAARKLVDGGSLIMYVGTGLIPDYHDVLRSHLTYWWEPVLLNDSAQKLLSAGVRASHKKILWYVKGKRRRAVHGDRITIVPDVLNDYRPEEMQQDVDPDDRDRAQSARDKSDHPWAQGDAGVRVWIHHLVRQQIIDSQTGEILQEPELIVDLFAGTGNWGRIAAEMGRRWTGCDVHAGGTEDIVADELSG